MRPIPLTVLKGGISRQRLKGGARADSLYDLVNGNITDAGTVRSRPGTVRVAALDPLTRGLMSFGGKLHTFCHEIVAVPAGYVLHILSHPESIPSLVFTLSKVHFSAPFLGFPYVVAEFSNGSIHHYWLRSSGEWVADTAYGTGDVTEPTTPNGLGYQATRIGAPYPSWAPNVARAIGDFVEPTVYNDFYFEAVDTVGTSPRSGNVEPDWPTNAGEQIIEDVNGVVDSAATTTPPPADTTPPDVQDRYGVPGPRGLLVS
jgi:hypothetical protein